jgi:arylformamidase
MNFTAEFVERGYNNRAAVPDHARWFAWWAAQSQAARDALQPKLDLRYGPGPKETLDLFVPPGPVRGTFLFLHGGYWRALDKSDHAFVAPPFVAAGYAVAVANYDLCPDVSIAHIVDECRRALLWLVRDGGQHGANVERIVVGGHSAGGHLAAMLFATDWAALRHGRPSIVGGVTLSGVHDLRPLTLFSFNTDFRLDVAEATRLSPVLLPSHLGGPLLVAVGADETSEFLRQSELLWAAWPRNRLSGAEGPLIVTDRNHFSVVADYADESSALFRTTLRLFEEGRITG